MSHYEERLEADLDQIRARLRDVGEAVLAAHEKAIRAVLERDRSLAAETILGDHPINRAIRRIDGRCHAFVARHLPSAGHLRFVSSVLRLTVDLERVGDYAVTMCRAALKLQEDVPTEVAADLIQAAKQSRHVLEQALEAWHTANADLAHSIAAMVAQASDAAKNAFGHLLETGERRQAPLGDLFALQMIVNRLDRVQAQAKNICEETVFAATGETKAPKVYRILFVDAKDDCASLLAAAYASKAFPKGGRFASAGWTPADAIEPRCSLFMERRGLEAGVHEPTALETRRDILGDYHVIVSLGGPLAPHVEELPFHTAILEWNVGPGPHDLDQERAESLLDSMLGTISTKITELMETLHGEGAA